MPVTEAQEHALSLASVALDPDELAAAVKRTLLTNLVSQTLCRLYGSQNGCHCRGNDKNCHAYMIWEDEGRAVVTALDRAGALRK